jgi:hypothetical protein
MHKYIKNLQLSPGIVVYAYNLNTWEAEVGGPWVLGQPGLHSETPSHKNKTEKGGIGKLGDLETDL